MGIRASDLPTTPAVTSDDTFIMSDSPGSSAVTKRATALQIKDYVGSLQTGQFTPNFTYTEAPGFGGNEMTFSLLQAGAVNYQHLVYDFTNCGSANPDFTFMKHNARLWFADLDTIGDEIGQIIVSNGNPNAIDCKGWVLTTGQPASKNDVDPATVTLPQLAQVVNALIYALTQANGFSFGHGLLRT